MIEKLKAALAILCRGKVPMYEYEFNEYNQAIIDLRSVIAEMEAGEPVEIRYRKHYPSGPHDGNRRVGDWMRMPYGARGLKDCATSLAAADCVEYLYTHPQPKAEPAQEPVAYRWKYKFEGNVETGAYEYHSKDFADLILALGGEPLYTHPQPKAEPAQKPVSWEYRYKESNPHTSNYGKWGEWVRLVPRNALETVEGRVAEMKQYIATGYTYEIRALYDSPQQKREPLTNKEITEAWVSVSFPTKPDTYFELTNQVRDFARAIEAAHGIK